MSEENKQIVNINWYPGHMAKTLREMKEDLKLIDIAAVILDARTPYASLNQDVYEIIKAKTVLMVFNKSDLADPIKLKEAEARYQKNGCYTVRTNSLSGEGIDTLTKRIREIGEKVRYSNYKHTIHFL